MICRATKIHRSLQFSLRLIVQTPASPATFAAQASYSPSKFHVPSRKQRNLPSGNVQNLEFMTEIGTSLLGNVRQLQFDLAEKEEVLKTVNLEKSQLEVEVEGLMQRLRSLDESEQRYKDENWSLETQIHDLLAAAKEASDREQRLTQSLNSATAENTTAHRELDELRQAIERQVEDHAATRKNYDSELSTLRRNLSLGDSDRGALQRKVEELTSQNQELARAMAARLRDEDVEVPGDMESDNEDVRAVQITPEHSPPPSPVKGTPRHSNLESETIKSSLHHAHRMIQNLKSNIHREKSEKVELKRMLQEARDELELRRVEGNGVIGANKRPKAKSQHDIFKKPARPSRLGGERNSRTDVLVDETGWEDHTPADSPGQGVTQGVAPLIRGARDGRGTDLSDAYQTANETDDVFDTANERDTATETEAFQTGAESLDGDSNDELTETEGDPSRGRTIRQKRPSTLADSIPGDFNSFTSTASESTDDDNVVKTPVQAQPQRYRLKINRGAASRRSRFGSEPLSVSNPSSTNGSPASFIGNAGGAGQTLFAELGELESTEEPAGTPSKVLDQPWPSSGYGTPAMTTMEENRASIPRLSMVDSAMMTEPWEPTPATTPIPPAFAVEQGAGGHIVGTPRLVDSSGAGERSLLDEFPATPKTPPRRDMGTQRTPSRSESLLTEDTSITARTPGSPLGNAVGIPEASTPDTPIKSIEPDLSTAELEPPKLGLSGLFSQHIEPQLNSVLRQEPADKPPVLLSPTPLSFSFIQSLDTRPIEPNPPNQSTVEPRMPAPSIGYRSDRHFNDPEPSSVGSRTSKAKNRGRLRIAEDDTSQEVDGFPAYSTQETSLPFRDISANVAQREPSEKEKPPASTKSLLTSNADQGSQTLLSSEQIEAILRTKERNDTASRDPQQTSNASSVRNSSGSQMIPPALRTKSPESPSGSISKARGRMTEAGYFHDDPTATKYPKRPGSSGSIRPDSRSHPPLPPDHREAIAAAAQKAPSSSEGPPGLMGPPLAPASAYKLNRPRTPNEPQTQHGTISKNGNPQRPKFSTARSQLSHRSSFSSFASELDERFNIRGDGVQLPYNYQGAGTDPRMIQAITQTMIGEYLWKYTRKPGRGELSDSRHRRYVWVHPYTRTLFWSERGPSVPGKAEGSSKNLPIEAVRVVTDDNPMPPGLHRKSLEIVTPERIIKLTATTGQRHETWFNAISYLLLRTGAEASGFNGPIDYDYNQADASDDLTDFNPTSGRERRTGNTRVSMSSYNSRAANNASPQRNVSSASKRRQHAALSAQSSTTSRVQKHQPSHGSISRLSQIFKPSTVRGSFSSRMSRQSHQEADPDADALAAHDSAEDLRQVIAKQEKEADRLENVRACCDGTLFYLQGLLFCNQWATTESRH